MVAYPSSSSNVVSCAASTIFIQPNGKIVEDGSTFSGGGPSTFVKKPKFQTLVGTPQTSHRLTPDVSANGGGYQLIYQAASMSGQYDLPTSFFTIGIGTSLSAPIWAGLWPR